VVPNETLRRLYGFGLLPLVPEITTESLLDTVSQISRLPHLRGLIMGTRGVGKGLDDDALDPVWEAIEKAGLVVFIHPHYGVDGKAWGDKDNGHVLPLALGFPFETTVVRLNVVSKKSPLSDKPVGSHQINPCRRFGSIPISPTIACTFWWCFATAFITSRIMH
jgi:hypothetical protein